MTYPQVPAPEEPGPVQFMRRLMLMLVLAVVLSAVEMTRSERFSEPNAIVMVLDSVPPHRMRSRPYRAHYRFTTV